MLLNSKRKLTFILNSTFQFLSIVVVSQLLVSCCASQTAHFVMKSFYNNKEADAKTAVLSKKNPSEQNQSKEKKKNGRAVVGKPYQIKGRWYYPQNDPTYQRVGEASWYGSDFHGRLTANGEIYDMNLLTAAHPTMPLPSYARVTNLKNGSSLIVRVNDRGPFMKDRIIDLSKQAAEILGYANAGVANVKVEYVSEAPVGYYDGAYLMASYTSGNNTSSSRALADISKEKENTMLKRFATNSLKGSRDSIIVQKQSYKNSLVRLPESGPLLLNKPTLFEQVALLNKLTKK
ncbi:septal ring lytic transglycosylase RlpA family protein [Bartonella florencae]|uniref:septal ring lytic transglycosylase RlpA family protein n=1 Tax=Bartonella florencae TaxID=928210 RepID=UPI000310C95E|nr:septal ring lytic transglycosylase RlpA family protein [Bartonella florencae]